MFSRNVKFQVDIAPAHIEGGDGQKLHCVNFTLLAGFALLLIWNSVESKKLNLTL